MSRVAEFRLFLEVHHGVARIVQRVIAAEQDAILRMLAEDGLEKIGWMNGVQLEVSSHTSRPTSALRECSH